MVAQVELVFRLILAAIFGGLIGFQRKAMHKPAGVRTHMLVAMGSSLFTIVSLSFDADPSRIAAGVVTGIGFLSAGTIFKEQRSVKGLTTAADLWAVAAIGLSIGVGLYFISIISVLIVLVILQLSTIKYLKS